MVMQAELEAAPPEDLLMPCEAATLARVHRNAIGGAAKRGTLPSVVTPLGRLFRPADVRVYARRLADRRAKQRAQAAEHATPMPAGRAG